MFKWLSARIVGNPSATDAHETKPSKPPIDREALAKVKEQLFYEWATQTHGDEEGEALYQSYLEVQRFNNQISVHGEFAEARRCLLRIAMTFPDAGNRSAGWAPPVVTDSYRRWFGRWCEAYPAPAVRK